MERVFRGDFLAKNRDQYQPCCGDDCAQVRRVAAAVTVFACDQCEVEYCVPCSTKCKAAIETHAGQTCAFVQASRATDFDVTTLPGIMACPKCSSPTEKNGGCNHMTCRCIF